MNLSPNLLESAVEIEKLLQGFGWRFCFIGGVAVQFWGEPRNTVDLDLTLLTGFGGEIEFIRKLSSKLIPRRADYLEFALANRVFLASDSLGTPIDVALGGMPFEERAIERALQMPVLDTIALTVCSATDLVIHKAFAGRERDWLDIRGILVRSKKRIDWPIIEFELKPLLELKETPDNWVRLTQLWNSIA